MASYIEANMQAILLYWDVLKWTTKLNVIMVKYLFSEWYANIAAIMKMLGGGKNEILGDLISAALYAALFGTLSLVKTTPVLSITPTTTHLQPTLY